MQCILNCCGHNTKRENKMSFICNQSKNETDIIYFLEIYYNNSEMGIRISKQKPDIETTNPERYFLDLMLNEPEVKESLTVSNIKGDNDPLMSMIIRNCSMVAKTSRRGAANIGMINSKLLSRIEPMMKKVSHMFNEGLIINDDIPENIIIVTWKGPGEMDGPFYISYGARAFVHPSWKKYVRVLELTYED